MHQRMERLLAIRANKGGGSPFFETKKGVEFEQLWDLGSAYRGSWWERGGKVRGRIRSQVIKGQGHSSDRHLMYAVLRREES